MPLAQGKILPNERKWTSDVLGETISRAQRSIEPISGTSSMTDKALLRLNTWSKYGQLAWLSFLPKEVQLEVLQGGQKKAVTSFAVCTIR